MADIDLNGLPHFAATASLSVQSHVKESGTAPSAEELQSAVHQALLSGQVFQRIKASDAEYLMEITLRTSKDSYYSSYSSYSDGDCSVLIVMDWSLKDCSTSNTVWKSRVSTSYTATFSDSLVAASRRSIAAEKSIKNNIEKALGLLAASDFAKQHALGATSTEEMH